MTEDLTKARCRDCACYDLRAVMSKNGRVLSHKVARCLWVSTEAWPLSIQTGPGNSRPRGRYMEPNDGEGCPCFTPLSQGST